MIITLDDIKKIDNNFKNDLQSIIINYISSDKYKSNIKNALLKNTKPEDIISRTKKLLTNRPGFMNNRIQYICEKFSDKFNIDIDDFSIDFMSELATYIDEDSGINSMITTVLNNIMDSFNIHDKLTSPMQTIKLNDEIGDVTELHHSFDIDVGRRDYPFLYIDNRVYFGNDSNDIHGDLIQQYLQDKAQEQDVYRARYRNINEINDYNQLDIPNDTPIAFGHVYKNIAFIETCENCSPEVVKNVLGSKFDKVYQFSKVDNFIKRLARKVKSKSIN